VSHWQKDKVIEKAEATTIKVGFLATFGCSGTPAWAFIPPCTESQWAQEGIGGVCKTDWIAYIVT